MLGFKVDLLKSSVLAVLTAILFGASIYFLFPQIEMSPRVLGTVDAYTEKGGEGPNIASNFYFANENVSVYAHVKDTSNNPLSNTLVTFRICGPLESNIILIETAKTDSAGLAVTTLSASEVGLYSVVSTVEIASTNITDSIAFEVKPPPTPFADVYTDRGGNGINMPSQAYYLNETVHLYAEVSNGTHPVTNYPVAFRVYASSETNQTLTWFQAPDSNESGIATSSFRIPLGASVGTWQVLVTVRINDQMCMDALTFECKKLNT